MSSTFIAFRRVIFVGVISALMPVGVFAAERIGNFTLLDERGKAVELHYHRQAPAIVLLAHRSESSLVARASALVEELRAVRQIPFFLINPVTSESRASLQRDKERQGISAAILQDDSQLVSETLGLSYAGEVLVINPRSWEIVYRGPVTEHADGSGEPYLQAALMALDTGAAPGVASVPAPADYSGELFDLPGRDVAQHTSISYSTDIAPLLQEKCANCHRTGGIGPWAMTSHAMVQGFSPMIREVLLTKRMPPWHADPQVNTFSHDMGLSIAEMQTLVHWIDAGAQRGAGEDPLAAMIDVASEWELGEPDLIVDLPAFTAPATGTIDYQFLEAINPLDRDVWVRAVQIVPGDRQVLHHAIATFGTAETRNMAGIDSGGALFQSQLMTFVPGNETYVYPEGTGVLVPAGTTFHSQMHYTTYGRETVDQTRIGLYFMDEEPQFNLQHYAILNLDLEIPPGVAEHEEVAYYDFRKDAVIYSLFPHAHYRGRSASFSIQYPDGHEELVLSVPNYDFNWQRYFQLANPLEVPAGTRLVQRMVFDNSDNNLSNPDPTRTVEFGEQTWEEMLYGGVSFRYANKEDDVRDIDALEYMTSISMGFMDKNLDGKIELNEMPERARQRLAMAFVILDKDKSGGLELLEFQQLMDRP
ncbi:MAG: hypothetical protein Q8L20_14495 [Gammaproteobacteria bacterium]|nr:hypothetical protein [Gammaproteobacteria bacterium]